MIDLQHCECAKMPPALHPAPPPPPPRMPYPWSVTLLEFGRAGPGPGVVLLKRTPDPDLEGCFYSP